MRQQGAALIAGLLVTVVMSLIVVSASKGSVAQQRMVNNYRFSIEAMNNAEVGVADAIADIVERRLVENGFDDELDANGDGNTDDHYGYVVADYENQVYYNVLIVDDDDGDNDPSVDANGIVSLMSQGTSDSGATRSIDVRIAAAVGIGGGITIHTAILAHGSITLSGNSELYGSNQDIHSNGDVWQADHVTTSGLISAVGTVDGTPMGGGTTQSGAEEMIVPNVDPADFAEYADYELRSNGFVYDSNGILVGDGWTTWNGWKFVGDRWVTDGDTVQDGMLYFTGQYGNVIVSSAPGTAEDPLAITILADGWIEIAGNPTLTNYMDPDDPIDVQSVMLVATGDIKINGNPGQTFNGIIATHEQFSISGNPDLEGAIIAQGASNVSNLVLENEISGVLNLTYGGEFNFPNFGEETTLTPNLLSWRDLQVPRDGGVFAPVAQQ